MMKCFQCGKDGATSQCSRCQCTVYCNQTCFKKHWKRQHKEDCHPPSADASLFAGVSKIDILINAFDEGAAKLTEKGYPLLAACALSVEMTRKQFIDVLLAADGEIPIGLSEKFTADERSSLLLSVLDVEDRLSPGFSAVHNGNRIPVRLWSSSDGYGRLAMFYVYSYHEGPEALKCLEKEYPGNKPETLCTALDQVQFQYATEPVGDPGDQLLYSQIEVAFKAHFEQFATAAEEAGIITGLGVKNNEGNPMYEVKDIESWPKRSLDVMLCR